jgi:predicted nucleic acid-binding protein
VIQLDTSFLIRALVKGAPQDKLMRQWLRDGTPLAVSAIAWAEFLCGPLRAKEIELAGQLIEEVVPFAVEDAAIAAELFNHSGRRRGSLMDCMVAASAMRRDVPLATANPADFKRLETSGLKVFAA